MAELSVERRERILQAMAQSVVEEGIQGASLRKVARRAHATTGMITHYYRNKNELIVDALRHAAGRYRNTLQFAGKPGLERLKRRMEIRFKNQRDEMPSFKYFMEYWAAATRSEELRKQHVDLSRASTASMTEDIEAAIDRGDARPEVDAATAAEISHALYYGLGILSTLDPEAYSEERSIAVYRAALDSLLNTRRD
jgi:AcrR family transcriptional regulator